MSQRMSLSFKLIIVLVWALPQMSTDVYLPSLPSMARYFGSSISQVQYTIFFYTVGFSLGALIFGPISDRIGRRPVILWSLALAVASSLIAVCATNLHLLFVARFIQGFALVGVGSTMRAVTKDVCADKQEMAKFGAVLGIAIPIAAAIAPIIGGYIEQYFYWRMSFLFLLVYIALFLIYTLKYFPETNLNKLQRPLTQVIADLGQVITNRTFFRYNAVTAFALCSVYAYLTESSYLLQVKIGLTPEQFGYTNLLVSATLIVSSYVNSKMIYHFGIDKMLAKGVHLLGIAGALFLVGGILNFENVYLILIPLVILVSGCGLIYPNASAGGLSLFNESAGTASAIYTFVQMLGGAAGSGIISWLTHFANPQECLGAFIILQAVIGSYLCKQLLHHQPASYNLN